MAAAAENSKSNADFEDEGEREEEQENDTDWEGYTELEMDMDSDVESLYSNFRIQEEEEQEVAAARASASPRITKPQATITGVEPMVKYPFELKTGVGNILTVHHTVKDEQGQQQRIRIAASCFNELSNKLLVIDKRGNIFIFDFVSKRYWRLGLRLPQATQLMASPLNRNEYLVANKLGQIFVVHVEHSLVNRRNDVGNAAIEQISWGNRIQSCTATNMLLRYGAESKLLNLKTLQVSHQLEFDQSRYSLKLAAYMPNTDQFFTCFTNDALHVWSSHTLQVVRIAQPIKALQRKLRLQSAEKRIAEFELRGSDDSDEEADTLELNFDCQDHNFADGKLLAYSFTPNGNKLCFSTLDGYLLLLSAASLELERLYRLRDFTLKQLLLLPQPKERILFGITARGAVIMLDLEQTAHKLIVQQPVASSLSLSRDGKLLSVLSKCGEVNVWSTCRLYNALQAQTQCISQVRAAIKQPKLPLRSIGGMQHELRQLLKRERLEAMLREYGCYPEKYRFIIWSTLLQLPSNGAQFQALLKLGQPAVVKQQCKKINKELPRRGVIKVWSCLAHWCKVFGYAEFMPHLLYPFVKQLPKHSLVIFELMMTLLLNHFQLYFEFYPLPPENYLAMCENLLQCHDAQLCKYYKSLELKSQDYAWSLLHNAFAEALEQQQWLMLWDNVLTEPSYFLIFVVVAYNMLHREVLLRLPDKQAVQNFFREQNATDVPKLLSRARKLMRQCDASMHPRRFLQPFEPVPKGVYPKFLNYPSQWISEQEERKLLMLKQQQDIDARIRHLELEELKIKKRLENGLKQEEHTRRLKEMEKLYQDTIQAEEERISCHRKMLLTYQLEVRQRKSEVITQLQQSQQRRRVLEMEKDIDLLMHSIERERRRRNQEMLFAEDEIRNQELELLAQRYYAETAGAPLAQKYYDNIQKMCQERDELQSNLREMTLEHLQKPRISETSIPMEPQLIEIERSILEIQREFSDIINSEE
ncbi:CG16896 [Drosophila busckii]|uniref:CG16896 n=1 Tax=Drosophila busckii TaxID=30019 RepID=A0A0M4EW19_DROBS|nr:TBC1 domain family member 31 [Drosophila busckii]ALC41920.1 CG16896 [Drosophila busckii]